VPFCCALDLARSARQRPAELGLPFVSWTLDRLVAYLGEKGIGMKRSRVSEIPGLRRGRLCSPKG
jgi:hypothetical protein